jgi:hypothetical protein
MSVRLLQRVLKEQELQQQQHHDESEEEEGESPYSGTRPAINPFDLLNDDDVDQVLFTNPSAYCTTILTDQNQKVTYCFMTIFIALLFISLFLCCL